jgi:hypothetical protein
MLTVRVAIVTVHLLRVHASHSIRRHSLAHDRTNRHTFE